MTIKISKFQNKFGVITKRNAGDYLLSTLFGISMGFLILFTNVVLIKVTVSILLFFWVVASIEDPYLNKKPTIVIASHIIVIVLFTESVLFVNASVRPDIEIPVEVIKVKNKVKIISKKDNSILQRFKIYKNEEILYDDIKAIKYYIDYFPFLKYESTYEYLREPK